MEIEQINHESKGYFKAIDDGKEAGRMTYSWAGEQRIIIDHTEVNPAFKGQHVGKKMLMTAVEFAREKNIKILPLCPFAKSVFDKTPDIQDVL
ncbi:GNAT family N-acetyltransferase [Belliella kenyensis]|uniref:GNAT family N-acetyltransferase n=1 Tax=Belliella kenyensis TaxID=1472724 RepID=A0ABV8ESN0_9BACT|nr:GNAT family N-acetyltransferase [Belliella kenyensis]MCH7402930.1 N-acetyltransferase [Belliella kenyensis]MDN3602636.1 GNAT family N-acetyltransferase [Belliella kenyensis]